MLLSNMLMFSFQLIYSQLEGWNSRLWFLRFTWFTFRKAAIPCWTTSWWKIMRGYRGWFVNVVLFSKFDFNAGNFFFRLFYDWFERCFGFLDFNTSESIIVVIVIEFSYKNFTVKSLILRSRLLSNRSWPQHRLHDWTSMEQHFCLNFFILSKYCTTICNWRNREHIDISIDT